MHATPIQSTRTPQIPVRVGGQWPAYKREEVERAQGYIAPVLPREGQGTHTPLFQQENPMSRIDQELEAILSSLGVRQESRQEASTPRQWKDLHITCVYSHMDAVLWTEFQPYLDLLKRRYTISTWHAHKIYNTRSMNDPWVAGRIKQDIARADIVLLGLSIHVALCLHEQGRFIYHELVERTGDHLNQRTIIPILLRTLVWEDEDLPLRPTVPIDKPIGGRRNRDTAYVQVSQVVEQAIERCRGGGVL